MINKEFYENYKYKSNGVKKMYKLINYDNNYYAILTINNVLLMKISKSTNTLETIKKAYTDLIIEL